MNARGIATLLMVGIFVLAAMVVAGDESKPGTKITVSQVLTRYIEAVGGGEAIQKLTSRTCQGRVTTDLPSRKPPVFETKGFEGYAKMPNRCLIVFHPAESVDRRVFDGEVGWVQDRAGSRLEDEAIRTKLQWLLNPQGALKFEEYFPELSLMDTGYVGEAEVYVLESAKLPAEHYGLHFDVKTGLLIRIGYHWELHDYRGVDGVLIPHRMVTSRKGGSTTYEFENVQHNVKLRDSLFTVPSGTK